MPIPELLNVYRHDRNNRALITLSGEIDMGTAPAVRESLQRCLRDGIRRIDVDLSAVPFCDCSGLNAFLTALDSALAVGAVLSLHFPSPMVARLLALTGTDLFLLALPTDELPVLRPLIRPAHRYVVPGSSAARALAATAGGAG